MLASFLPIALVAYIVGVFLAALATGYQSDTARGGASALFVVAWLAHGAAVIQRGVSTQTFPLTNLGEYLLMLGWVIMTLHLALWFAGKVYAAGLVLPPLAGLACFAAMPLLASSAPHEPSLGGGWFLVHTTVSTLGMATLCVALAMSLIYLSKDRALKAGRTLRLLKRLPSLDACDRIGFRALWMGFTLLTIGIGTGIVMNETIYNRLWVMGIKQTLPFAAWAVFLAVLVARLKLGVRGRKSAYLTIAGVMLGLLTVAGMTM
jgi:ABC-type uncharacterized transport system permease subunit